MINVWVLLPYTLGRVCNDVRGASLSDVSKGIRLGGGGGGGGGSLASPYVFRGSGCGRGEVVWLARLAIGGGGGGGGAQAMRSASSWSKSSTPA